MAEARHGLESDGMVDRASERTSRAVRVLRVLIADAAGGNGGLSGLLEDYDDFEVVGHAKTAIDTLTLVERLRPDAVLLDMEMPGDTFAFVLKLIKRDLRPTTIVVMIPYASYVLRERSLEAGADLVFEKTGDPERLLGALLEMAGTKERETQR
jgi:two-component system response regulator DesR